MDFKLLLVYQESSGKYDYLAELKRCVRSWRKNGGFLKDCEILLYTDADVDLDVTVKKMNFRAPVNTQYKYFAPHQAGLRAQADYPDSWLLHIDLDMELLRPLPEEFFEHPELIGVYSDGENPRPKLFGDLLAETDFVLTGPGSTFYENYFRYGKLVLKAKNIAPCNYWAEEYVADYLVNTFGYKTLSDYENGQGFKAVHDNPYFSHQHIEI